MSGHLPVMLAEVLEMLAPRDGAQYVYGTFGGGGYASAILEAADCKVLGIDRDPDAIARGQALVERFGGRYLVRGGEARVLEGQYSIKRFVVLEFPTLADAQRFYDSPDYQPVKDILDRNAVCDVFLVDGCAA